VLCFGGSAIVRLGRTDFVPCDHEYLNLKGAKPSKSRGAFVDVPYYLSKYDPDPLCFYLTATAPETRDTEFSWEDFVERNNNELVATARLSSRRSLGRPGPTPKGTWVRPRVLGSAREDSGSR